MNKMPDFVEQIYFDNASTTKPYKEIVDKANEINQYCYGNPASIHRLGLVSEKEISMSLKVLAELMDAKEDEIIFTSGGTESNNLAILGVVNAYKKSGNHIITNLAEHSSVIETYRYLEKNSFKVTYLPLNTKWLIDLQTLENSIEKDTILISIMHVNNETGIIQDIPKIYDIIKRKNEKTLLHVDGVQGFGKHKINFQFTDLYSFSVHKIHGLKGIGGLFVKNNIRLDPIIHGGSQQRGVRPGTENMVGVTTLSLAAKMAYRNIDENLVHVSKLKAYIISEVGKIEDIYINGDLEHSSPYIINISVLGIKSENLLHALESDGIFISAGAACNSKNKDKNILKQIGLPDKIAESAIRISLSPLNNMEEAKRFITSINKNIIFLRRFSK